MTILCPDLWRDIVVVEGSVDDTCQVSSVIKAHMESEQAEQLKQADAQQHVQGGETEEGKDHDGQVGIWS